MPQHSLRGKGIFLDLVWKGLSGSSTSLVPVLSSDHRLPFPSETDHPHHPLSALVPLPSSYSPLPSPSPCPCQITLAVVLSPSLPPARSSEPRGAGTGAPECSTGSHRKREMIPCGFPGGTGALS